MKQILNLNPTAARKVLYKDIYDYEQPSPSCWCYFGDKNTLVRPFVNCFRLFNKKPDKDNPIKWHHVFLTRFVPGDLPLWRRVRDTGNSSLNHQLRPVVKLHPNFSTCQLHKNKTRDSNFLSQMTISLPDYRKLGYLLIIYLGCPSNIWHKYWFNHFSRALYQVLTHWRAFLTQAGCGEIRPIVGNHLEIKCLTIKQ